MGTSVQKIISLGCSREIPFNKLVLSQSNVRRTKAGVSIEDLAEDIARRGLLQNLNVRPVLDGEGQETGVFEVPAGGRRYRALEHLARTKRLAKTAPIPCNVREASSPISAEEDSLAENVHREALHPLDQFRAFKALIDRGLTDEEVAARFFVSPTVVKQRLRLVSVSPALLEVYAEDGMTLDQLMAFTVTGDHTRQEQVWEAVSRSYNAQPYTIRRQLTEGAVRPSDPRAQFVGSDVYEAAGGVVTRDLFQEDDGGWLEDAGLLDRLAAEKLAREAEAIGAEGWKWIEAAVHIPYGRATGMRRIYGQVQPLTEDEQATDEALSVEYDRLCSEHDTDSDLPEEVDIRLGEIETALAALRDRPTTYDAEEIARAGVFLSINGSGRLTVERGFVRPEDEPSVEARPAKDENTDLSAPFKAAGAAVTFVRGENSGAEPPEEDDTLRPLSERLVTELTAHRTLALRDAVATDPDAAHLAVLHALCLPAFYPYSFGNCLELSAKSSGFSAEASGLKESASVKAIAARQDFWARRLPKSADELWAALLELGPEERTTLFAHVASLTVNVTREPFNRRPQAAAHGEALARTVGLDMAMAGWKPTVDTYLGRVPKARILEAVREGKGEMAAQLIDHLKKPEMAKEAERLLADTGWVPEPLRVEGVDPPVAPAVAGEVEALPDFLADEDEPAPEGEGEIAFSPHLLAAE